MLFASLEIKIQAYWYQIFRQYALLAEVIRTIFQPSTRTRGDKQKLSEPPSANTPVHADQKPLFITGQEGLVTLSNDDPNDDRLSALLGNGLPTGGDAADVRSLSSDGWTSSPLQMGDVRVDVTLRTQLGQAPALMLLVNDPGEDTNQYVRLPARFSLCLEIGLNGRISVVDSGGLVKEKSPDTSDTEMQGADDTKPKLQELHRKIARALEISQDLGTMIEWVLHWLRQRAVSG